MIGDNIQQLRLRSGITLSELAERTGVSKSYLSSIERNIKKNPSIHVIGKIALELKVDLETLLNMEADFHKKLQIEKEWLDFIGELKKSGLNIQDYRILVDFIKWRNENKE